MIQPETLKLISKKLNNFYWIEKFFEKEKSIYALQSTMCNELISWNRQKLKLFKHHNKMFKIYFLSSKSFRVFFRNENGKYTRNLSFSTKNIGKFIESFQFNSNSFHQYPFEKKHIHFDQGIVLKLIFPNLDGTSWKTIICV